MTKFSVNTNLGSNVDRMKSGKGKKLAQYFNRIFYDRIVRGYQKFSDDTNITGFKEMYYAKSYFFKIIWFVLILFGIVFTTYQCWFTVNEYLDEPTNTVVQQLRDAPAKYPPLQLCYAHWIFWLDWNKFLDLNTGLDRDSFLYGMSFAKTVFIEKKIENLTAAKQNFNNMMKTKNYPNLTSFYLSVVRDEPLGVTFSPEAPKLTFTKNFHDFYGSELCYTSPIVYSKKVGSKRTVTVDMTINFEYKINISYISELELNYFRHAAFAYQSSYSGKLQLKGNETAIYIPPMIYIDGTNDMITPDPNYFLYLLRLKGSVYKWRSSSDRPCTNEIGIDFGGEYIKTCQKTCDTMALWNSSSCVKFSDSNRNYYNADICMQNIVLANLQLNETLTLYSAVPSNRTVLEVMKEENFDYVKCMSNCERPCEQWIYETSIVTSLRPHQLRDKVPSTTDVEIQYPVPDTIIVMTETPSTTWQKMLSDIGGLLGLWVGATLFSFVQVIYLCCCTDVDEFCSQRKLKTNKVQEVF